jgi:hypothetical protein
MILGHSQSVSQSVYDTCKKRESRLAQHARVEQYEKVLLVHLFSRFSCHQKSAEFALFGSSPTRFCPKIFFQLKLANNN